MIRLTELSRAADRVQLRIEGNLTDEALAVLQDELQGYHATGVTDVELQADGLQIVSHHIATAVVTPDGLRVCFVTSRSALYRRLLNYGLLAELVAGTEESD